MRIAERTEEAPPNLLLRCNIKHEVNAIHRKPVKLSLPLLLAPEGHGIRKRTIIIAVACLKRGFTAYLLPYRNGRIGQSDLKTHLRYMRMAEIFEIMVKAHGQANTGTAGDGDFAILVREGKVILPRLWAILRKAQLEPIRICFSHRVGDQLTHLAQGIRLRDRHVKLGLLIILHGDKCRRFAGLHAGLAIGLHTAEYRAVGCAVISHAYTQKAGLTVDSEAIPLRRAGCLLGLLRNPSKIRAV